MTKYKPTVYTDQLELLLPNAQKAILKFKTKITNLEIEEINVDDKRIEKVWGDKLYRLIAEIESKSTKGRIEYRLIFEN